MLHDLTSRTIDQHVSHALERSAELAAAAAVLEAEAGTVAAIAVRAAAIARERGDRIEAILAEIRHVRAGAAAMKLSGTADARR